MNLYININKIHDKYIFYNDPIDNTILNNGQFIKIQYSNNEVNLNNITTIIEFEDMNIEKTYNKIIYSFCSEKNKEIINKINTLEDNIINKYIKVLNLNDYKVLSIKNQLQQNKLKLYYTKNIHNVCKEKIILKISGLWIHNNEIGIIYKFFSFENN